ncbi:MAG: hypothetical protein R3E10_07590 [Gemmatimonadota bacterium]
MAKLPAALLIASSLVATSCAEGPAPRPFSARDSAGVRIVMSQAPVASSPWTLDILPSAEIGADASDTMQVLFRVSDGTVLEDGSIVLATGAAPMLRWFDEQGQYVQGTGRQGGGPGEFGSAHGARIQWLWPLGDSVATWEHAERRMQVFGPEARYSRMLQLEPPTDPGSYPQLVGPIGEGFLAFLLEMRPPGVLGAVERDPIRFVRYGPDGKFSNQVFEGLGYSYITYLWKRPDGTEDKTRGRPPFSRNPVAAVGNERLYFADNEAYSIAVLTPEGTLQSFIRRPELGRALTTEMVEAYKAASLAGAPEDPEVRRRWKETLDDAVYPEYLPWIRQMLIDRIGMLWVQEYVPQTALEATWSVFDPSDGHWLGDIVLPMAWQVLEVGADYVLAVVPDDFDVERVRRYALYRSK